MNSRNSHAGFLLALLILAGCQGKTIEDIAPKATQALPAKLVQSMQSKGMSVSSPIMVRIFKEEGAFEIWKQKNDGRYGLVTTYPICKWSGQLGPKMVEGDRQAPEGFYTIHPYQMNPQSKYYLAFNIGYPNAFDKSHGRTGSNLMVHGACSSSGCYSMTDAQVGQIYAFARDAFKGGQQAFQIQAFPFRMTAENMARYRNDPNIDFWKMLKVGYDLFEITHTPPKVDVCDGRYVFDETPAAGHSFSPGGACPQMSRPPDLVAAYNAFEKKYDAAYAAAVKADKGPAPKPSLDGLKEAKLVANWTRELTSGKEVPISPPSMDANGKITESTTRLGRIDSPLGRKMAALDAEKAAKKKAAEEKAAALAAAKAEKLAMAERARAAKEAAREKARAGKDKGETAVAQNSAAKRKGTHGSATQDASAASAENALAPTETQSPSLGKRIWNRIFGS
jgi:murein L,D-transpeptidase YafK